MDEERLTLEELARRAGVTPRTVRYYTAEELLPPPRARGKYALYNRDHLLRLQLILKWKEAYLPLSEIRTRLAGLSADEIERELADPARGAVPEASAAAYIERLLAGEAPAAALPGEGVRAPVPRSLRASPEDRLRGVPPPAPPPAPAPGASSPASPDPAGATWSRWSLSEGVELHVRDDLPESVWGRVRHLVALARKLFLPPK